MSNIGLALSGGGIRGIAHLGVLEYLEEIGIKPAIISGASAGSLVAAFYAAGYSPKEIQAITKAENFFNFTNLSIINGGIFKSNVFERIVKSYIPHNTIEKLKIAVSVTVTDLTNARTRVFETGDLSLAVRASCCVPLVFQPVQYEGTYLSDGGILDNFPVAPLRTRCDKIIGVNVSAVSRMDGQMSYKQLIQRTLELSLNNTIDHKMDWCDVYIEPPNISNYGIFDFDKMDEIFELGYTQAQKFEEIFLKMRTV